MPFIWNWFRRSSKNIKPKSLERIISDDNAVSMDAGGDNVAIASGRNAIEPQTPTQQTEGLQNSADTTAIVAVPQTSSTKRRRKKMKAQPKKKKPKKSAAVADLPNYKISKFGPTARPARKSHADETENNLGMTETTGATEQVPKPKAKKGSTKRTWVAKKKKPTQPKAAKNTEVSEEQTP